MGRAEGFVGGERGEVFESEEGGVSEGSDAVEDEGVVQLAEEEFVTSGDTGGVEVADDVEVALDVCEEVAFHDLHVVAIEEELEPG